MFYPAGKTFETREERLFARQDFVYNVTEDLLVAIETQNITKQDLANRLGKSRSFVTQLLSGSRNMTLGTLSDICFALDIKPTVKLNLKNSDAEWQDAPSSASVDDFPDQGCGKPECRHSIG
jgi:transcriptional regulator with XRE-family HTH domain